MAIRSLRLGCVLLLGLLAACNRSPSGPEREEVRVVGIIHEGPQKSVGPHRVDLYMYQGFMDPPDAPSLLASMTADSSYDISATVGRQYCDRYFWVSATRDRDGLYGERDLQGCGLHYRNVWLDTIPPDR